MFNLARLSQAVDMISQVRNTQFSVDSDRLSESLHTQNADVCEIYLIQHGNIPMPAKITRRVSGATPITMMWRINSAVGEPYQALCARDRIALTPIEMPYFRQYRSGTKNPTPATSP
jgi:hypothetical protein